MHVCFLLCSFQFFSTKPRDWLGRMSPKWLILCRVGRKTSTQSVSQSFAELINMVNTLHTFFIGKLLYTDSYCSCFKWISWYHWCWMVGCGVGVPGVWLLAQGWNRIRVLIFLKSRVGVPQKMRTPHPCHGRTFLFIFIFCHSDWLLLHG